VDLHQLFPDPSQLPQLVDPRNKRNAAFLVVTPPEVVARPAPEDLTRPWGRSSAERRAQLLQELHQYVVGAVGEAGWRELMVGRDVYWATPLHRCLRWAALQGDNHAALMPESVLDTSSWPP
jgi:hypothetical protein